MAEIPGDDGTMHRCSDCGGLWVEPADLNRILLHANLPALSAIGGWANPDEMTGQCPACHVDLVVVEGGEKRSLAYDTCESCGGSWVDGPDVDELPEAQTWKQAEAEIVSFFKDFRKK
jgi:Zn-finger nucleic acid-binding protein